MPSGANGVPRIKTAVCDDGQHRAVFDLWTAKCHELNSSRPTDSQSNHRKPYTSFDRLNKVLRNCATALVEINPNFGEVVACVIGGNLHISANAESDQLVNCLRTVLTQETKPGHSKHPYRGVRAIRSINQFVHHEATYNTAQNKMIRELTGEVIPAKLRSRIPQGMSGQHLAMQASKNMQDFRNILKGIVDGGATNVLVHPSPTLQGVQSTPDDALMHAEQTVEQALATMYLGEQEVQQLREYYGFEAGVKVPIVVALEGRLVPCAVCYEVEHTSQTAPSGFFNPKLNRLVLYRSSDRAGAAYAGAGQPQIMQHATFSSNSAEGLAIAKQVLSRFGSTRSFSRSAVSKQPVILGASYSTDSEDSNAGNSQRSGRRNKSTAKAEPLASTATGDTKRPALPSSVQITQTATSAAQVTVQTQTSTTTVLAGGRRWESVSRSSTSVVNLARSTASEPAQAPAQAPVQEEPASAPAPAKPSWADLVKRKK